MKQEDLMLGDWYQWYAEDRYYNYRVVKNTFSLTEDTIDNFEPIPITPEILEKNGFVLESDGWIYYQNPEIKQQDYICVSFRHNSEPRSVEINFIHKAQCVFRQIYEVHELQHALKICGITKNIEL